MVRDSQISRRTFLGGVAGTLVSIGLPGTFMVLAEPIRQSVAAQVRKDGKPRVPPGQTPIEYIPDMGGKEGKATTKDWQLHIHGDLGKTVTLTFEDLLRFEQKPQLLK